MQGSARGVLFTIVMFVSGTIDPTRHIALINGRNDKNPTVGPNARARTVRGGKNAPLPMNVAQGSHVYNSQK